IDRRPVLRARRTPREREVVIESGGMMKELVLPTGVRCSQKGTLGSGHDSSGDLFVDVGTVLISRHQIQKLRRPGTAGVEVVLYTQARPGAFLGLNENDAIGCAGPIDRSRGVFQNRD